MRWLAGGIVAALVALAIHSLVSQQPNLRLLRTKLKVAQHCVRGAQSTDDLLTCIVQVWTLQPAQEHELTPSSTVVTAPPAALKTPGPVARPTPTALAKLPFSLLWSGPFLSGGGYSAEVSKGCRRCLNSVTGDCLRTSIAGTAQAQVNAAWRLRIRW